jgi:negative regulator of sigma E activity
MQPAILEAMLVDEQVRNGWHSFSLMTNAMRREARAKLAFPVTETVA